MGIVVKWEERKVELGTAGSVDGSEDWTERER